MKCYAGIGSRDCPKEILVLLSKTAFWLSNKDFVLRSGGAEGCDTAFEIGCDKANGKKEIYLPWSGFNKSKSQYVVKDKKAFDIAAKYHPRFATLKDGAKKLQARNSHQVLGWNLESPSLFVICYTKEGKGQGGTGQAIRIANDYAIPVFDFGKFKSIDEARSEFMTFIKPFL